MYCSTNALFVRNGMIFFIFLHYHLSLIKCDLLICPSLGSFKFVPLFDLLICPTIGSFDLSHYWIFWFVHQWDLLISPLESFKFVPRWDLLFCPTMGSFDLSLFVIFWFVPHWKLLICHFLGLIPPWNLLVCTFQNDGLIYVFIIFISIWFKHKHIAY